MYLESRMEEIFITVQVRLKIPFTAFSIASYLPSPISRHYGVVVHEHTYVIMAPNPGMYDSEFRLIQFLPHRVSCHPQSHVIWKRRVL